MPRFEKLLVCASESDQAAVRLATRLAVASGASVTLVDTIERIRPELLKKLPQGVNVEELMCKSKEAGLQRVANRVRRSGITPATLLLEGPPADAFVLEADRGEYDLLVVGAAGTGAVDLTGTSAARLVQASRRPVLIARHADRVLRPRILVSVDAGMLRNKKIDALTMKLLESATWLAEMVGGEVHVLHVWQSFGDGPMRRAGLSTAVIREYNDAVRRDVIEELEEVIAPFRDRIHRTGIHVRKGDPRTVISTFTAAKKFNLLVIGSVGRSGISRHLLGNTAEKLLRRLPCSMLVLRPNGPTGSR